MNKVRSIRQALTVCALLAVLLPQSAGGSPVRIGPAGAARSDHPRSWMSADAKTGPLMYVSDEGTSAVYVYSVATYHLVGVLSGFNGPRGMCVNKTRDIWVTNAGSSSLLEFPHGGTRPIATLSDPGQYPVGCSVEATSDSLAAANIISAKEGPGSLSIYRAARGFPAVIPAFAHTYTTGYDPAGDLFVNGEDSLIHPQLGEIVRGQQAVTTLTLVGGAIQFPGDIQYADGSLAIGDVQTRGGHAAIYQVTVSGSTATITGKTELIHSKFVVAFFILGNRVFCLNALDAYGHVANYISVYNYPAGGLPIKIIHNPSFSLPVGLTISV